MEMEFLNKEPIRIMSVASDEKVRIITVHPSELDSCIASEIGGAGTCNMKTATSHMLDRLLDNDSIVIYSADICNNLRVNAAVSSLCPDDETVCFGTAVICKLTKINGNYDISGLTDNEILTIASVMGIVEEITW